ncbi:MAG TPA: hypothetical protein PLL30_09405 [Candidatus Krumholzibacteria bacterium]|nr:hypothetical protein [Candidatus Krumholzibacteria bacterium]HPD71978.1 hypothetical protein [Candidatus Krumholzibacteria bacterium]HRY41089.1 hypothetical protein [Candidatus Krumholzibacteria bacterium]
MAHARILPLALVLAFGATVAAAATITSTAAGGLWSANATWIGGIVPGSGDDVVLAGPVTIAGTAICRSLAVNQSGSLAGAFAGPSNKLQVSGAVTNDGVIDDGSFNLFLEVGGDLHNAGVWANYQTTLTGPAPRSVSHEPTHGFATDFAYGPGSSGDLIATTPLSVTGDVDMTGGRLVLEPGCPFSLDIGAFSGSLAAGGNTMHVLGWSYLQGCTIDDVVLAGEVNVASATFTTRVTVEDILQNTTFTGGGSVTVEGDLINHGTIRNVQYSFPIRVHGNIENDGSITNPQLELVGVGAVHHLSMGPSAVISATIFLPEFQAATLVADTPVRFAGGLGLGVGSLVLQPGCSLRFTGYGAIGSGTILANGNAISVDGTGYVQFVTIDRGVIADQVAMAGDVLCTDGLTVTGTLTSWTYDEADVVVEGLLRNEGTIQDGAHPVRITALGDLANTGTFKNLRVVLAGTADQAVGTGATGLAVAEFVLESGLDAASYQWYRDGQPIPGATAASLLFATVGADDWGTYHCVGDGLVSRAVLIAETIATTGAPDAPAAVALAQNSPNPFNPATDIAFGLEQAARVSLTVYDLAGREVARLVDGDLPAGPHRVAWQPRDLPSGTYVYRLRAGAVELSRKCTLLK